MWCTKPHEAVCNCWLRLCCFVCGYSDAWRAKRVAILSSWWLFPRVLVSILILLAPFSFPISIEDNDGNAVIAIGQPCNRIYMVKTDPRKLWLSIVQWKGFISSVSTRDHIHCWDLSISEELHAQLLCVTYLLLIVREQFAFHILRARVMFLWL